MLAYVKEGNQRTQTKTLGARQEPTTNSINTHGTGLELKPGCSHWWEASALATEPSLLPCILYTSTCIKLGSILDIICI